jgi:solute carrier family 25 (mitochondrial folate transporter), member 32
VALSAASKTIATTLTYPYQVLKSRLQARNSPFSNSRHALRAILVKEGIRGLYGGFGANLIRVVPGSAVTIATFELVKAII